MSRLPKIVAHADWGTNRSKRILAVASLVDGRYQAGATGQAPPALLSWLRDQAGGGAALVGFDFPIGLPWAYAEKARIRNFRDFLSRLSPRDPYFSPAVLENEIGPERPFYPAKQGGTSQAHLLRGLKLAGKEDLWRVCEWRTLQRGAACPLFWTLGPNQVGKGALCGWKEELLPALQDPGIDLKIWPFDGTLEDLLTGGRVVVIETYPGEVYHWFDLPMGKPGTSKQKPEHRKGCRSALYAAAKRLQVDLSPDLRAQIESGFGPSKKGEDPFDAFVGLLGMIEVVRGSRETGLPPDDRILQVEGWILGQKSRQLSSPPDPLRPLDIVPRRPRSRRGAGAAEGGGSARPPVRRGKP